MKNFILIIIFLATSIMYSQYVIKGTVKDKDGNPLEMANVIAMNITEGSLEGYSITDAKGKYSIKISKEGDIQLKVSYLGFESQSKILVISASETTKDFVLLPSNNELDPVEITYEMPVTIKGDTIVYNADSFTSGREKKLGDVLKKLPGVEVNDNGEIEVEGKPVNKVMVDGKDFFDGDTKLATKNIPADAVKKVEVLKNYNEVSQMRGLGDDSDNVAINIKLKEGKKNFWFGEITAGTGEGGNQTRYLAHPKLFYYGSKKSINIITDINNIGEIPFTFNDYFKFSGGFNNIMKNGGIQISSNSLGLSFLKDNKAKELSNKFAAINFTQQLNEKLDISGFAIFSDADTEMQTNTFRTNTFNDLNNNEIETNENITDNTFQNNILGLLKLSASYKANPNFQLNYDVLVKKSNLSEKNRILSDSDLEGINTISNNKNEEPISINNNLNIYYTLNDKNIFSLAGQFLYEKNNPLYNSINSDQRFMLLPTIDESTNFDLTQNKEINTNKLDAVLDYYYILNKKSNINITLGSVVSKQQFQSNIYQRLDDNSINNFNNPNLNNDVSLDFTDTFIALHYKVQTGKFIFTPGISLHNYISENNQLSQTTSFKLTRFLPDLNVKFSLKNSENLRFRYNMSANFTDITNLSEGILLDTYNSVSIGNRNLENALFHQYNLNYFNFNTFSFTNIHAEISYSKRESVIKNTSQLLGIDRINTLTNLDRPEDNLSANASISKRIKKIKISLSGNTSIANNIRLTTLPSGDIISDKTKFTTQSYRTSLRSNFSNFPNFELGYSSNLSQFNDNKSITNRPFANIEIVFLKDFVFITDYKLNYYHNQTNNIKNTFDFLNADLYYQKEGSSWEFRLQAINLLNTESINEDAFSVFTRISSVYFVQPRMLMFSVKYDL